MITSKLILGKQHEDINRVMTILNCSLSRKNSLIIERLTEPVDAFPNLSGK